MSPTTLKRLWGYIDGADKTRNSTLEILSRFLGFANWDAFVESISQEGNSNEVLSPRIKADELKKGDLVKVSWMPNRRCTFHNLSKATILPSILWWGTRAACANWRENDK